MPNAPPGANIQLPLTEWHHNGAAPKSNGAWIGKLAKHDDGSISSYAKAKLQVNLDKGKPVLEEKVFAINTRARRGRARNWEDDGPYRSADPGKGNLKEVLVKCKKCGTTRIDHEPAYYKLTGAYLVRRLSCSVCKPTASEVKIGRKTGSAPMEPVDLETRFVHSSALEKLERTAKKKVAREAETTEKKAAFLAKLKK
ncbi:hypothetical protein OQA88_6975 [Cercophora sp. LCS_1]